MTLGQTPASAYQSYVAPEDVEIDTDYALTMNPRDQILEDKQQAFIFWHSMNTFFHQTKFPKRYWFYMERSNTGHLHVHGVINFSSFSEADKFYNLLSQLKEWRLFTYKFGTVETIFRDEIDSKHKNCIPKYATWKDYCKKQKSYWLRAELPYYFKPSDVVANNHNRYIKFTDYQQIKKKPKKMK